METRSLLTAAIILWVIAVITCFGCSKKPGQSNPQSEHEKVDAQVAKLVSERKSLDETVWSKEVLAQEYEQVFIDLWDHLRATKNKLEVLASFPFEKLELGKPQETQKKDLGILLTKYSGNHKTLDSQSWRELLSMWQDQGFELIQSEWHHASFFPDDKDSIRSTVNMTLHVLNEKTNTRYIVKGSLEVKWAPRSNSKEPPRPLAIDATKLQIIKRTGDPAFRSVYEIQPEADATNRRNAYMPLVMLYDLDRNGLSEIILPLFNQVYYNRGDWKFEKQLLFQHPPDFKRSAGIFADFTGDGRADYFCQGKALPELYIADSNGLFTEPPIRMNVIDSEHLIIFPSVITAGDIDKDGDLDVWLAQYKNPYHDGQMPTPYYDANDGYASYLLRNDGNGKFKDITAIAGLAAKRFRRTYSSSLVDLDDDQDLDLVVCSDFSGLDVYLNDGHGVFTDVSETIVDHRHSFGMSLTFGDYNKDGKLDFFMTGMGSTTARRLEQLGLGRDDFPAHQQMRMEMGYGNRMYLAEGDRFLQAPFNDQVARTGWSWGSTSFDFDNDSDRDVYVANGHISGDSAKDYCTKFWRHDIYTGGSKADPAVNELFRLSHAILGSDTSWNGFEHNSLLMNENGKGFLDISFLMGSAFEFDSRNIISDDLNGDGKTDLVVVEMKKMARSPCLIHILENRLDLKNHWIGVRLQEEKGKPSPLGVKIILRTTQGSQVSQIVSGDSFSCQHAPTVHFGLGSQTSVEKIEIIWLDGSRKELLNPQIDQYHHVSN